MNLEELAISSDSTFQSEYIYYYININILNRKRLGIDEEAEAAANIVKKGEHRTGLISPFRMQFVPR